MTLFFRERRKLLILRRKRLAFLSEGGCVFLPPRERGFSCAQKDNISLVSQKTDIVSRGKNRKGFLFRGLLSFLSEKKAASSSSSFQKRQAPLMPKKKAIPLSSKGKLFLVTEGICSPSRNRRAASLFLHGLLEKTFDISMFC